MIQKKMLNRFKDKNPSPLNSLDSLLTHTYSTIISQAGNVEVMRESLAQVRADLSNTIEICILLTVLSATEPISEEQYQLMRSFLSPLVDDGNLLSEVGWEETCSASTAHLLRTSLSKKQQAPAPHSGNIDPLESTDRLKK
jgi:Bardet-Biedl syndrome 9 protein